MLGKKKYPSLLGHLSSITTETRTESKEISERFSQWQHQVLRVMRKTCWDPLYMEFHNALAAVLQKPEFVFLAEEALRIYEKTNTPFPGFNILSVGDVKVMLTLDAFVIVQGEEISEASLTDDEQQGIAAFSQKLQSLPGIIRAINEGTSSIWQFILNSVNIEEIIEDSLEMAISAFAMTMQEVYEQDSGNMYEFFALSAYDQLQWKDGVLVVKAEDVLIYWKNDSVDVVVGDEKESLKILRHDLDQQLLELLRPHGRKVFQALPTSKDDILLALVELNELNEEFPGEDTSPGLIQD